MMIRKTLFSCCLLIIATAAATDALYYGESPNFHQFSYILQSNNLILYFLAKEVNTHLRQFSIDLSITFEHFAKTTADIGLPG